MYPMLAIDALDVLMDFTGTNGLGRNVRDCKRAVILAVDAVSKMHHWKIEKTTHSFITTAKQNTGTLTYDHTGGTHERLVTFTGHDTFPSDLQYCALFAENKLAEIERQISSSELVLREGADFGADLAAGTTFVLFQDRYVLPFNVREIGSPKGDANGWWTREISLEDWLSRRAINQTTGDPSMFALAKDVNKPGRKILCLYPAPDTAKSYHLTISKAPRPVTIFGIDDADSQGTITVTAASKNVTGNSSAFPASCEGSVLRWHNHTGQLPTGPEGEYRYSEQQVIAKRTSSTALIAESNVEDSLATVRYLISDPIDLDPDCLDLFLEVAKLEVCKMRKELSGLIPVLERNIYGVRGQHDGMLGRAKRRDAGSRDPSYVGAGMRPYYRRLADMPMLADDDS